MQATTWLISLSSTIKIRRGDVTSEEFGRLHQAVAEMQSIPLHIDQSGGISIAQLAARARRLKRQHGLDLLEDISIDGARGLLINITASSEVTIDEISEASTFIQESAHDDCNIIWGTVIDDSMGDEMRVTVIATGIGGKNHPQEVVRPKVTVAGGRDQERIDPAAIDHIDLPRFVRSTPASRPVTPAPTNRSGNLADLDVPTFLRRQAD